METTESTAQEQTTAPSRPGELIRPIEGRIIAGVAQGVSNRFGIPDWLVRVGFVVTSFVGGLGVVLYLAGWVFLRSEDEVDTPADRFFAADKTPQGWIGLGLVLLAGIIVLGNVSFISGEFVFAIALLAVGVVLYTGKFPSSSAATTAEDPETVPEDSEGAQPIMTTQLLETTDPGTPVGGSVPPPPIPAPTPPALPPTTPRERSILGRLTIGVMLLGLGVLALLDSIESIDIDADPRHYLALAVTILGVGLLVGSVLGRARWLIVVGAVLIPTLMISPVFEYNWGSDDFELYVAPASFAELDDVYTIDVGRMVLDLSALDWDGETVDLIATVDAGSIEVRIPDDVAVTGQASVGVGRVAGPQGQAAGLGEPTIGFSEAGDAGHVILDLSVGVGNIDVFNR